ncbi:MAG TPA: hypothetical protein DDZ80_15375 [Cyanobacteria bacterium UBA8803]|nr:hypothetical protein [Cyanobacteria bacterium UBA9273]HBL59800.1 hypothetical protein [Cyanobacteria bacterium UBA8803]
MPFWFSGTRPLYLMPSYQIPLISGIGSAQSVGDVPPERLYNAVNHRDLLSIVTRAGLLLVAISMGTATGVQGVQAQSIIPAIDGTGTLITTNGNQFDIQGGTLSGDGANLFHSFQQFGLSDGQIANFISNPDIRNILGRVIGGDPSIIHGLVQVIGGNSNLFLMNPVGIVFGENAQLNVPASFTATTATGIGFDGGWFKALGTNQYNALIGNPNALQFETLLSGAIINAANLTVSAGQNLAFVGGTVLSTGTLVAPGGNMTLATVPGTSLVRLSPAGQILSLEIALPTNSQGNPLPVTPLMLPQLLTGSGLEGSVGVKVDTAGQVQLAGSDIKVQAGDVAVNRVNAGTATLSANRNLTLNESQLVTTGDMHLLAGDNVLVRDSVANPVRVRANGNLYIQGDRAIDILALNHPETPFISGGNLSLVSNGPISGDAHFASGGSFSILNLLGEPGTFESFYDPIISAEGNVTFGDYTGVSLKVEATGNITAGTINITGPDTLIPTADPDVIAFSLNTQPGLVLRAGRTVLDNPANVPQTSGGTTFNLAGGLPSPGNVTVLGDITVPGGPVVIEARGDIVTGDLRSGASSPDNVGNGGAIALTSANGNISTGSLDTSSVADNTAGDGGAISLTANNGNISTGNLDTFSSGSFGSGNGGAIALLAINGSISTGNLESSSNGSFVSFNGGAITLVASNGITITGNLDSSTNARGSGNGGGIALTSAREITITGNIDSFSTGRDVGKGGAIDLIAVSDITITGNLNSSASSGWSNGDGGAITLTTTNGSMSMGNLNASSGDLNNSLSSSNGGAVTLTANNGSITTGNLDSSSGSAFGSGNGGVIALMATNGSITTATINSFSAVSSTFSNAGNGGGIALIATSDITVNGNLNSYSYTDSGIAGNAGTVILDAVDSITLSGINNSALNGAKYGDITLTANEVNFTGGVDSIWGDNNKLVIQPKTLSQGMVIGGTTDSGTTTLDLLTTDLTAIKSGFTSITLGRPDGTGTITMNPFTFNAPVIIAGGSTLVGPNQNTTWNITTTDTGNLSGFPNGLTFSSIENLAGGSSDDNFIFSNGATLSGKIDGGAGSDTLNYSAHTAPVTVNLANLSIRNIETAIGGSASDILIGPDTDNTWEITANHTGTINNTFSFSSFENLIGTQAQDIFQFSSGVVENLTVDAGLGSDRITVNQPTILTGNVSLSTGADGGDITFNSTVDGNASLTLTAGTGNIIFSGAVGKNIPLGNLLINSAYNLIGGAITAASITHTAGTGTINLADLATSGGSVQLATTNNLTTGNITTTGGEMRLTSHTGAISSGNLVSAASSGGNIVVNAAISITAGDIDSSGFSGNGGNVSLDPINDIQVSTIDARGGVNGRGGEVDISTQQFFRATGSFLDENGIATSISTAGGLGGGNITIRHGGNGVTPFVVGDATTNGTAGTISTGLLNRISPPQSFSGSYTQGNIQILTQTPPPKLTLQQQNPITVSLQQQNQIARSLQQQYPSPQVLATTGLPELEISLSNTNTGEIGTIVATIESNFTNEFQNYLGLKENSASGETQGNANSISKTGDGSQTNDNPAQTLVETRDILRNAEALTGIKPALIYIVFVPDTISSSGNSSQPEPTDRLQLILVTSEGDPVLKKVPGAIREQVINIANQFRREITNTSRLNTTSYLEPAQQLYQWTVAQLETELKARGIGNLVFILDAHLRSLPMAALHDGQGFLIERYSIGLMPSLNLVDTRYADIRNSQVLGMGASKFTDQNPLPAASEEVTLITQQLWEGKSFTNEDFTLDRLISERQQTPFGIIHLATHGEFKPGRPSNSYIQLWDKKLGLDEVQQLGWNNPPVELLVLSACRTALGDEEAELGFAGLAVQAGVKTAVASLWYVSDEGSLGLMTEFYRQLREAPIKAEALRQAQLALLRTQVRLQEGELRSSWGNVPLPPELAGLEDKTLSHPYYWSAFTMIGSPW